MNKDIRTAAIVAVTLTALMGCSKLEGGVDAANQTPEYKELEVQLAQSALKMMGSAFSGEIDQDECEKMVELQDELIDLYNDYQDTESEVELLRESIVEMKQECNL